MKKKPEVENLVSDSLKCAKGVTYALYISLSISKVFYTKGCMGGGVEEGDRPSHPTALYRTEYRISNIK